MKELIVDDVKGLYQKIKSEVLGGYDPELGLQRVRTTENLLDFIVGYAYRSGALNEVMKDLKIKQYCAEECPKHPKGIGCCNNTFHYKYGIEDPIFLALQEVEAINNGWKKPVSVSLEKGSCLYHQDTGCSLNYFEPPQCLGRLCGAVTDARVENDDVGYGENLSDKMYQVKCLLDKKGSLNPANFVNILETMDSAIALGRVFISIGWAKLSVN